MAGDWIKMRCDLFSHPKVVRIMSALEADALRTVGGLMSAWCLFDAHSVDGKLEGYNRKVLDAHLQWPGFSAAMVSVRWLIESADGLELPDFDTHNGVSAKRRAQDSDRKKSVRKMSASQTDVLRTREEKRREENITTKTLAETDAETKPQKAGKPIFNYSTEKFENLTAEMLDVWAKAYPAIDVRQEILKAKAWLVSNPKNRKSDIKRFLNSWLSKAQDSAPRRNHENDKRTTAQLKPSAAGSVRDEIQARRRERAALAGSAGRPVASDVVDVRPQVGEQLRDSGRPGRLLGDGLDGDIAATD